MGLVVVARLVNLTLVIFLLLTAPAIANLYSITVPRFSGFVEEDGSFAVINPANDGKISRSKLDKGRLYFSFTILGAEETLRYLMERGVLEVKVTIYADGDRKDTIEIGMTQDKWSRDRKSIVDMVNNSGFFTWRTFMYTNRINSNIIELIVKDARGSNIRPPDVSGSYTATINIVP